MLDLEWRGQKTVSMGDLRSMLGASEGSARSFAHRLVEKRWLERIRPGLFQLIPLRRPGTRRVLATRTRSPSAPCSPTPTSTPSARPARTTVSPSRCSRRSTSPAALSRRPVRVRNRRFSVFVAFPQGVGSSGSRTPMSSAPPRVRMATKERALLDALDRPAYGGRHRRGLPHCGEGGVTHLRGRSSLTSSRAWGESAVAQRLRLLARPARYRPRPEHQAAPSPSRRGR